MSLDHVSILLKELGTLIGLPELCLDEQKYCCLGFDDAIRVHLRYNEGVDEIIFYSGLAPYEEGAPGNEKLFESLLAANLFWQGTSGGTLAIDAEAKHVYLMSREHVDGMDFQRFQGILENFVNRVEYWLGELGGGKASASSKNKDEAPQEQLRPSDLA